MDNYTDNDVHIDVNDLQNIFSTEGKIYCGYGECNNSSFLNDAMQQALENIDLQMEQLANVTNILVHFQIDPKYSFFELSDVLEIIYDYIDSNAKIVWATTSEVTMANYAKIMIIVKM